MKNKPTNQTKNLNKQRYIHALAFTVGAAILLVTQLKKQNLELFTKHSFRLNEKLMR